MATKAVGLAIIGTLAVVLAISFAALIFKGALGDQLGKGASLMLIGGCVLGLLGAVASSLRGAVLGMQDAPAIILALAAGSIAAGWSDREGIDLFSTVAMLLASSTFAIGATLFILGHFRLGSVVRYLPYPVIGGFMAATGWFLLVGALGMMTGSSNQAEALEAVLSGANWLRWAPGVLIGGLLLVASRRMSGWGTLPMVIGGAFVVFYALLFYSGQTLDWAGAKGLLLGPFPEASLLDALPLTTAPQADWAAIAGQSAFIIAAVAMAVVGMLLNLSGVELATGRIADVDGDLKRVGLVNIASGGLGGGAGYILISLTLLARNFGVLERMACVTAGLACGLALIFDASLIGALPVCVFGGITAYLGADLLYQWLWEERRRLPAIDYAIVLSILLVAAAVGFLEGIGVGIAASVAVFIYSRISAPVIRRSFSNRIRFSTIDRSIADAELLDARGDEIRVYQIEGVLFFGTISKLATRIAEDIAAVDPPVRRVIVDLEHIQDLDSSAIHGIVRTAADCRRNGVELSLAGLRKLSGLRRREIFAPLLEDGYVIYDSLDDALEQAEEETLQRHGRGEISYEEQRASLFKSAEEEVEFLPFFEERSIALGDVLIFQGDSATDIFFIRCGALAVEIGDPVSGNTRVGVYFAGALLGEMALYTDRKRSASVVALSQCEVLCLTRSELERMEVEAPHMANRMHRFVARQISVRLSRMNNLVGMLKA